MTPPAPDIHPSEAELARLADGSLPEPRRSHVTAAVAASPALARVLDEQRAALAAVHAAAVPAPASLRAGVRAATRRQPRAGGHRRTLAAGLAAAAAAALVAVLALLPGGNEGVSVAAAAALAQRPTIAAAPTVEPRDPRRLTLRGAGLSYPNWAGAGGWRPLGSRTDRLGDRTATTLVYARRGQAVAYTIARGTPARSPAGARSMRRGARTLWTTRIAGRSIVAWEQDGRTCVLSSASAPVAELIALGARGAPPDESGEY